MNLPGHGKRILGAGGYLSDAVAEVTVQPSVRYSMAWSNVGLSAG